MKKIFFFLPILVTSCAYNIGDKVNIPSDQLATTVSNSLSYYTPKDNVYKVEITCFNDYNKDKYYDLGLNLEISKSIGDKISYVSEKSLNTTSKHSTTNDENTDYMDVETTNLGNNSDGISFIYDFLEDDNGEYYAHIDFLKQNIVSIKKTGFDNIPVLSTNRVSQDFYPENKVPYKFFESSDLTEVCYLTTSW